MKEQKQEDIKQKNREMAAKAGNKAEELQLGNMDAYEAK